MLRVGTAEMLSPVFKSYLLQNCETNSAVLQIFMVRIAPNSNSMVIHHSKQYFVGI